MTQEDNRSFTQKVIEYFGRRRVMEPIPFDETSILTQPGAFRVGGYGYYLPLPAMTAAIITSPAGQKMVFVEGGYKDLQNGAYTIQYVDLRERTFNFPAITASTLDGLKASLTVSISYKVSDPVEIVNVSTPLQALLSVCKAAIKKFIIAHHHHEIIGEPGDKNMVQDYEIIQAIRKEVAEAYTCRAFAILNIVIIQRQGDPEMTQIKQARLIQEKQGQVQRESVIQQQDIADQQGILAYKKAELEQTIRGIEAEGEANVERILYETKMRRIVLEYWAKLPEMQQERFREAMDFHKSAITAIIQLQSPGFPRDASEVRFLENIIQSVCELQKDTPQLPSANPMPPNDFKATLIKLIKPPK